MRGASEVSEQFGPGQAHGAGQCCKFPAFGHEVIGEALGHGEAAAGALNVIGNLKEVDLRRMGKDQARH
jgi:hypothetical protein